LKTWWSACITLSGNPLPDADPNQMSSPKPRRWTVVAAGFLLLALALVVIYTSRGAFLSPLAMVVVAAIGLAALLLQLRRRKDLTHQIRAPLWLNVLGLIFAIGAVFADILHLHTNLLVLAALGAVICFAISGVSVLQRIRRQRK
jgi:peptidoglycan/LPS O-acetylase OafA/YrhL